MVPQQCFCTLQDVFKTLPSSVKTLQDSLRTCEDCLNTCSKRCCWSIQIGSLVFERWMLPNLSRCELQDASGQLYDASRQYTYVFKRIEMPSKGVVETYRLKTWFSTDAFYRLSVFASSTRHPRRFQAPSGRFKIARRHFNSVLMCFQTIQTHQKRYKTCVKAYRLQAWFSKDVHYRITGDTSRRFKTA